MNTTPILITNPTNIRYLTGFIGAAPEERESYLLLINDEKYFFTNSLYTEQSKQLKLNTFEISRENPFTKKLAEVLAGLHPVKSLNFEENDLTVSEYQKLRRELHGITLIPTSGHIEKLRMTKRENEIDNIRQAAIITDDCFSYIVNTIKIGVSESKIAWEIETYFRQHGAGSAFSPIVAFGKNSSQPHYSCQVSGVTCQENDIILLDFGARINDYCADMTRVVFVGTPKPEWIKAYSTVLAAEQKALELLSDGIRSGTKLDEASRKIISEANLPTYPHSLGHAVGLDIHEAPRLSIKKDEVLRPGMVITIEPGVYIEGQYGIRLEDLVLLKDDGIEILSRSKYEKIT